MSGATRAGARAPRLGPSAEEIRLEPNIPMALDASVRGAIPRSPEERVRHGIVTWRQPLSASRAELSKLLPRRQSTPGHRFAHIVLPSNGRRAGECLHPSSRATGKRPFWVDWLRTRPECRLRGYASQTLVPLSDVARRQGAVLLGLFVLEDSAGSVELYRDPGSVRASRRTPHVLQRPREVPGPARRTWEGRRPP